MTEPGSGGPAASLRDVQEAILAEMAELDDPLDKYEYLVGQARELTVPEEEVRQPGHLVPGCQSRTWIRTELREGRLRIQADSEAMINRGIIALLLRVLDGRRPAEVRDADLFFLRRSGLETHLSPSRANGMGAMVKEIRSQAEAAVAG